MVYLLKADSGFTDLSSIGRTVTNNTGAVTTAGTGLFGTNSFRFNNSTSTYIASPDSDDFNFGTGDFTLELFIRWNTSVPTNVESLFGTGLSGGTSPKMNFIANANPSNFSYQANRLGNNIIQGGSGGKDLAVSFTWAADTWYHIAYVRQGTSQTFYVNGTSVGTNTLFPATAPNSTGNWRWGTDGEAFQAFSGDMDEMRITKGVARYTSNFTAPSATFPTS